MKRSQLVVDRIYYVRDGNIYFVTPDGIGGYWYDTQTEAFEQHGESRIYTISHLAD